ncbi:hypothetical protein Vi05172_g11146 [Venturia inaequalis]|nr:hypothetical protein Vi05172_g11146 [Venturia inaequalis]
MQYSLLHDDINYVMELWMKENDGLLKKFHELTAMEDELDDIET